MGRNRIQVAAALGCMTLALGPVGPAAAAPQHESPHEEFVDDNFCGTGIAVPGTFDSHDTTWQRDGVTTVVHEGAVVWAYQGQSLSFSFAGQFTYETVQGDASGIHLNVLTSKGTNARLQLAQDRVLTLDAGLVAELVTLTPSDETLDDVIVRMSGPHPMTASFGSLFCPVATSALGIG